jgi:hypothetical protein
MVGGSGRGELAGLLSFFVLFLLLIEDRFQRVVAEVAAADEPLVVLLDDDARCEPDERAVVGEDPDDVGAPADLAVARARSNLAAKQPARLTVDQPGNACQSRKWRCRERPCPDALRLFERLASRVVFGSVAGRWWGPAARRFGPSGVPVLIPIDPT